MKEKLLTKKQKAIADFVIAFIKKNGYKPTLKTIGQKFGVIIPTVQQHMNAIKLKGFRTNLCLFCGRELK